jgi:CheY-like chemotaxis protein
VKRILLVEDDDADAMLAERAISRVLQPTGMVYEVIRARDGIVACDKLFDGDKLRQSFDLVLLDLHLPRMSGIDCLKVIRANHSGWKLPVVIMTTSNTQTDIEKAYLNRTNGYVEKPLRPVDFNQVIQKTFSFWLDLNQVPQ